MEPNVLYRGELGLRHTGTSVALSYSVVRVSDAMVVMSHSVEDEAASMTEFDTVAFYQSKNSTSPTYELLLHEVQVSRNAP
jgi:hypothetical protein